MKKQKNKLKISTIVLALMLVMTISLIALPTVNAHDPPYEFSSWAFIVAAPDPVGVDQTTYISLWVDRSLPNADVGNDIRRGNYTLTITKPDGSEIVEHWDVIEDTTGIAFYPYMPDMVGEYTLRFDYGGQTYTWADPFIMFGPPIIPNPYTNDTFAPASKTITLTVQEDPLPGNIGSYPLPMEYWTRPIEAQNTYWGSISSNWLATRELKSRLQPDGIAPNSAHVMWTKAIDTGGVVGGTYGGIEGQGFYTGLSYNMRWTGGWSKVNPIIMNGVLYYELPEGSSPGGGGYIAVDLRTGEEIWYNREIGAAGSGLLAPSFGYYYNYDSGNQHGVLPTGALFSSNFEQAYNPLTGELWFNVTGVPTTLAQAVGENGEILRYVLDSEGKWLAQWSSKYLFISPAAEGWGMSQSRGLEDQRQTIDASRPEFYDWNITLPTLGSGEWSIATEGGTTGYGQASLVSAENMVLLIQTLTPSAALGGTGSMFQDMDNWDGANVTAVSLKPESRGEILWANHYPTAEDGISRYFATWDLERGIFVTVDMETMGHNGWSLETGNQLWGTAFPSSGYDYFNDLFMARSAYGNVYYSGYGGVLYCWDIETGKTKWTYGNDAWSNNNSTFDVEQPWGYRPIYISTIAEGKIYLLSTEHSPNTPLYKDALVRCVNATTGEEIWTMMGWGTGMHATEASIVADGYLVYLNCYDMQLYSVGKGPSATTLLASPKVSEHGSSVLLEGNVLDICYGAEQKGVIERFPNGLPAVSDESMGDWMEYVYMQKPRPADVTGVQVKIEAYDPNGNYQDYGTVFTDGYGNFALAIEPEVPGQYWIKATFEGSESYWGSTSTTYIQVDPAPSTSTAIDSEEPVDTTEPTNEEPTSLITTELTIIATVIVAAVICIVTYLILRRK